MVYNTKKIYILSCLAFYTTPNVDLDGGFGDQGLIAPLPYGKQAKKGLQVQYAMWNSFVAYKSNYKI